MAVDESLARTANIDERTLFGCACFFLDGYVLAGVWKDVLIARVGPDEADAVLREPHVRAFDIAGKPMRNWVAVEPEGVEGDDQLSDWLRRAEAFVQTQPAKPKGE